jgi:competence protein ComEC
VSIQEHGIIDRMPSSDSPSTPIDTVYYRPIIPLALAFIFGIVGALYFPGQSFWFISLAVLASGYTLHSFVYQKKSRLSPLILFACMGYLSFASIDAASLRANHVAHFRDGRVWNITGTVASTPVFKIPRQKCVLKNLKLLPISGESPTVELRGNIQINIYGKEKDLAAGNRIMVTSQIKPVRSFHNPGGFDYTRYMLWQNIWGTVSISDNKLKILPSADINYFTNKIHTFRSDISDLILKAADGDARAVLSALIIGDRRELSSSLQESFNRAGVSHVLSISGLHVGIVATAAFVFFKWLLSFSKPLLLRAWTKKTAAICAVFPVIFYGLIAGMPPATQRSVIMVSVFLMSFLIEREHDLFNTIASAALLILIIDPPALFSISFQLSFAAVLSISWGMSNIQVWISQSVIAKNAVLKYIVTLLCVSLCAILGVAPLVMRYFNTFPISGVFANLLVVPLMGSLVVIIGLFSILVIYPFSSHIALWGLKTCSWILKPVIDFIYYLSDTPFAAIKTITPSILEIICFYLLVWGCISMWRGKGDGKETDKAINNAPAMSGPAKDSWRLWIGAMVAVILMVLFIDTIYWANRRLWNDEFRVTLMDVGQGNAAVLEMPGGSCMVIDGGGFGDNASFDIGERILAPFLWGNKIRTVDTVVLTHPDSDHLNGLVYILKYFHVKQVISTHQTSDSAIYRDFVNLIQKNAIAHPDLSQIQRTITVNGATVDFLHPDSDFMVRHASLSPKDINNNSIVAKACFGGFSILFPGDIMDAAEKDLLLKMSQSLDSTLLIAPHHGSKTSSTGSFLDAVDPKVIIVSCGKEDHFPSKSVLERYKNRGVDVFRTDYNGAIRVVIEDETMMVEPMQGDKIMIRH